VSHYIRASIRIVSFILCLISAAVHAAAASPVSAPDAVTTPRVMVLGFVGGFVKRDDMVHGPVQLAARLIRNYPSGVYVEVLENHRGQQALADIVRFVHAGRDGTPSLEEKHNARIILYGHSWGASEAITLARELEKEGIPVLLTVQVDSVTKPGQNDKVIPANVAEAANFYQLDGLLHGESQIRAADPARTHIIGNFRSDYKAHPIDCKQYPWYDRLFMKPHTEIECDPRVWTRVESLIRSRLTPQHQ
jgi:hypothetical protein